MIYTPKAINSILCVLSELEIINLLIASFILTFSFCAFAYVNLDYNEEHCC